MNVQPWMYLETIPSTFQYTKKITWVLYECLTMDLLGKHSKYITRFDHGPTWKTLQIPYECSIMDLLEKHSKYLTSAQPCTYLENTPSTLRVSNHGLTWKTLQLPYECLIMDLLEKFQVPYDVWLHDILGNIQVLYECLIMWPTWKHLGTFMKCKIMWLTWKYPSTLWMSDYVTYSNNFEYNLRTSKR